MLELKDTIEQMESADYKERFKAEFNQLNIRYGKLMSFVDAYALDNLTFKPDCSLELLQRQLSSMRNYLDILIERAEIEDVQLNPMK